MNLKQQITLEQNKLELAVTQALDFAKKAGASDAEVAISRQTGLSVSTRMGEVENVEFNHDGALGICVYRGQRKGNASTSDLSDAAIQSAVAAALDIALHTAEDEFAGLADFELMAFAPEDLDLCHPIKIEPEYAIEQACLTERLALAKDSRIVNSEGSFTSHSSIKVYGNSHGLVNGYASTRHSMSSVLIAEQDGAMERDYGYSMARDASKLWTPEQIATEAVNRTVDRLGARKIDTCNVPVIFHHDVASSLMGQLVMGISGGSLYRKSSFLLDKLGEQIFPEWLNIQERPHIKGGLASSMYDAEGVRTKDLNVVEQGILKSYLLTSYSGRKLGMQTTGHAGGIHNWNVTGKGETLDQLCRQMGTGLLVTELMGQGVNIVTGDYSRGASGFWVENGELQYPVHEITIAGNLTDMFKNLVAVGNDIDIRSSILMGSTLLESMQIAGN
ncbi:MAG: metalloprotease PmbA [Moritella sp.]|nr:MAG: metalloprotease PmbA [Moritella sp.]